MMSKIKWKKLPYKDFEDIYMVSNKGDIKSIERTIIVNAGTKKEYKRKRSARLCSFRTNGISPHLFTSVTVLDNGVKRGITIFPHKAVGLAFIPNPDEKPFVAHKSNDYTDNSVENLFWTNQSEVSKRNMAKNPYMRKTLLNANKKSGWLTNRTSKNDTK
jgi:hypothetical protein